MVMSLVIIITLEAYGAEKTKEGHKAVVDVITSALKR